MAGLEPRARAALQELLLRLADDELVLGHRDSEWTGFAPLVEEDVAFASIAQDEIGHAAVLYGLLAELAGGDPDGWAYGREAAAFRNAVLLERDNSGETVGRWDAPPPEEPRRDWAFCLVRQYLYDLADELRLTRLLHSSYAPLRAVAERLLREERYHRQHGDAWLRRLATASAESRRRLQAALGQAWDEALGLFEETDADPVLAECGLLPGGTDAWRREWLERARAELAALGLRVPPGESPAAPGGRSGRHSADLQRLLDELTCVRRLDPEAVW